MLAFHAGERKIRRAAGDQIKFSSGEEFRRVEIPFADVVAFGEAIIARGLRASVTLSVCASTVTNLRRAVAGRRSFHGARCHCRGRARFARWDTNSCHTMR